MLREVTARRDAGHWPPSDREIDDLCASFQRVVVESLLDRLFDAARWHGAASVGIAGGVSANSRLRHDAVARGERTGIPVFIPRISLSTDNAAMSFAQDVCQRRLKGPMPIAAKFGQTMAETSVHARHFRLSVAGLPPQV